MSVWKKENHKGGFNMSKVSNFIAKEFDTIIKDSREYRAYELGVAGGYFHLYSYIKEESGIDFAKNSFKAFINEDSRTCEYFRKLIELDEEPMTELEEKIERYRDKLS